MKIRPVETGQTGGRTDRLDEAISRFFFFFAILETRQKVMQVPVRTFWHKETQ